MHVINYRDPGHHVIKHADPRPVPAYSGHRKETQGSQALMLRLREVVSNAPGCAAVDAPVGLPGLSVPPACLSQIPRVFCTLDGTKSQGLSSVHAFQTCSLCRVGKETSIKSLELHLSLSLFSLEAWALEGRAPRDQWGSPSCSGLGCISHPVVMGRC